MDRIVLNVENEGQGTASWQRLDEEDNEVNYGGPFDTKAEAMDHMNATNPDNVPVEIVQGPAYPQDDSQEIEAGDVADLGSVLGETPEGSVEVPAPVAESGAGGTQ